MASAEKRPTITVTFEDVLANRAYIRIGPEARIKLAHKAGAPWNPKIPDARLHDMQQEVVRRPERLKIVHGGSRLGKSVLGGVEGLVEAMIPGSKLGVIAARYDHVGAEWQYIHRGLNNLFKGLKQAFVSLKYRNTSTYHDYYYETIWGSVGQGFSSEADDGGSLLGREFSRVILGEGSHIGKELYERRILRAVDGWLMQSKEGSYRHGGYISIYTTPKEYLGCSAAEWERIDRQTKKQPEKLHYPRVPFIESAWLREADVLENPYYDRRLYEARKASMSKAAFDEQYRGLRSYKTGRVIAHFDDDRHVQQVRANAELVRRLRLGLSIDTGAYTGIVLAGIDRDRTIYQLAEVYTEQATINATLAELRTTVVDVLGPVFGARDFDALKNVIDIVAIDPASQHKLEIMDDLGGDVALTPWQALHGGKLELIPSVEAMDELFAADRVVIDESCDYTVDQLKKYIWKQRKAAGGAAAARAPVVVEPKKEYDHLVDALRGILILLDQYGPREEPPAPLTFKDQWEADRRSRVFGPLKEAMQRAERDGGVWV